MIVAWDTETHLFGVGNMAPPIVCHSFAYDNTARLFDKKDGLKKIRKHLESKSMIVGQNIAYDFGCLISDHPELIDLVFDKYDRDEITDTMIRQKLIDIAQGTYRGFYSYDEQRFIPYSYTLAALAKRHMGVTLDKTTYRTGYTELENIPIHQWTEGAREYAINDAKYTLRVFKIQEAAASSLLADQYRQARASFALRLASAWGIETDPDRVDALTQKTNEEIASLLSDLKNAGLVRANKSRNIRAVRSEVERAYKDPPKTDKGSTKTDAETCRDSGSKLLQQYARFSKLQNIVSKEIPMLRAEGHHLIHTRFDELMETGRTSSSGPNIQNIKREPGIRECFRARKGMVFVACDYDGAELHTLAQVCLWLFKHSKLAELLNKGMDVHTYVGSFLARCGYDDLKSRINAKDPQAKQTRTLAKPCSFGFAGGLGAEAFSKYAKSAFNLDIPKKQAYQLKEIWLEALPEMKQYFDWVSSLVGPADTTTIKHFGSDRQRGLVSYTACCNSFFQGLAADAAKEALWHVCLAQYADHASPLFNTRTVNFIHDEIIIEVDEDQIDQAAKELQRVMVESFNRWCPDVPATASAHAMRRWSKTAEAVYDDKKRLICWGDR